MKKTLLLCFILLAVLLGTASIVMSLGLKTSESLSTSSKITASAGGGGEPSGSSLLLETGDAMLLETSDYLLLE